MNFKTIQLGDKNDLVGDWQSFLRGENIYLGAIDDDFGNATETATKEFQKKYKLEDDGMSILQIKPYKEEELIYDVQKKIKISSKDLIKSYLKGDGLKMVSVLNNKIVIQKDEDIKLFSLKNEKESSRFIDCLSSHFFKIKRGDCLFVKDYSSPQRKYLYGLLESNGFDKKVLYRKFTTYPSHPK